MQVVCDWRHKWSSFRVILAHVAWPRAQPLGQSISLKFSLETRLESESFEPLIDCLAFLVQKIWSKINKLINYLISQLFLLLQIMFWTWNHSRSSKASKDSDCSLVSNKNFSELLPSIDLSPGPGEVGQGGLKVHQLWRHSQKIRTSPAKFFSSVD